MPLRHGVTRLAAPSTLIQTRLAHDSTRAWRAARTHASSRAVAADAETEQQASAHES